jgi:hypothetical protein
MMLSSHRRSELEMSASDQGSLSNHAAMAAAEVISLAAFHSYRRNKSTQLFGFDPATSSRLGIAQFAPDSPESVARAGAALRAYAAAAFDEVSAEWMVPTVRGVASDSQLLADKITFEAMQVAATGLGVALYGEEDRFRALADGHERDAARERGQFVKYDLGREVAVAVVDPIDGTNQAEAMGNRSGFCHAVMIKAPRVPLAAAVVSGCGRVFSTDGSRVWVGEAPTEGQAYEGGELLDPAQVAERVMTDRLHAVVPASKASTLNLAKAMTEGPFGYRYLAPLAGIPGILAGLVVGGCAAAIQLRSYPWDQMAAYFCATLGLPVLQVDADDVLDAGDVEKLLLGSLVVGERVPTLLIGKNIEYATRLRSAYLHATTDAG